MGLMHRKKSILLNEPHIDTVSGSTANFSTDMVAPLYECRMGFKPVQSGVAYPNNPVPISGWTGLIANHSGADTSNPTVYNVSWQTDTGTIYGGYMDLVKGTLVAEWTYLTVTSASGRWYGTYTYAGRNGMVIGDVLPEPMIRNACLCTHDIYYNLWIGVNNWSIYWLYILDTLGLSTIDEFKDWLDAQGGVGIAYKLNTPIVYQLGTTMMKTNRGTNNIWSNANDNIQVKYWTH